VMQCLREKAEKEDKFYCLGEDFQKFREVYPFMLLDSGKLKAAAEKGQGEYDKALLYPYAKFPSEIIPGKLYLVLPVLRRAVWPARTARGSWATWASSAWSTSWTMREGTTCRTSRRNTRTTSTCRSTGR
jgi:hypothetical protein